MADKRIRNNRFNVEWVYAKECWDALGMGTEVPPVPMYTLWETEDFKGEKIVGHKPITPMKVTSNGVTVY